MRTMYSPREIRPECGRVVWRLGRQESRYWVAPTISVDWPPYSSTPVSTPEKRAAKHMAAPETTAAQAVRLRDAWGRWADRRPLPPPIPIVSRIEWRQDQAWACDPDGWRPYFANQTPE